VRRTAVVGAASALVLAAAGGVLLAVAWHGTPAPAANTDVASGSQVQQIQAAPSSGAGSATSGGTGDGGSGSSGATGVSTSDGPAPSTPDGSRAPSTSDDGCPAGVRVTYVGGRRDGVSVREVAGGFQLRVAHPGDGREVVTGTVTADAPLVLRPMRLEGRDSVGLTAGRRTIAFRFYDYGRVDGIDFTGCVSALSVSALVSRR
jgi:hypothetical protein